MLKNSIFITALLFGFLACSSSDEELNYPITFIYNNLEIGAFYYYVVDNNDLQEIEVAGTFTLFETHLPDELTIASVEFPFDQLTLLNETEIRLVSIDPMQAIDTILNYTETEDGIRILLDETNNEYFNLEIDIEEETLKFCIQSFFYSFLNMANQQDYAPLELGPCTNTQAIDLASGIVENNSLITNDTIAINYSYLVFD